jgi:2-succinyl-6-hydroxy-2,4-cyclohexadiene-1-carboxylate synthase
LQEINVQLRAVDVFIRYEDKGNGLPIVFLHGFTGDSRDWVDFAKRVVIDRPWVAIDLLGHGKTGVPVSSSRAHMREQVAILEAVFDYLDIPSVVLLGYSMGGRVALAYTISLPTRVAGLILESASPGLKTEQERASRRADDAKLATQILELGIAAFIEKWENTPLFSSQKRLSLEILQHQRDIRTSQKAIGLANSLRGMGTGSQPSLWSELHHVQTPLLLLSGEYDTKFTQLAVSMQNEIHHAKHVIIKGAGHNVHLESPHAFWVLVRRFMKAISQ